MTSINTLHKEFQTYGKHAKHWIRKCQLLLPQIRDEEVWKKKGFASIYEYAAKLAGMSHNSVNEALRVMDAIEDKPLLKQKVEKFGINRVKPVVTVATSATEEFWAQKTEELAQKPLETYVREYKNSSLRAEGQRLESQNNSESTCGQTESPMPQTANVPTPKVSMYMKLDVEIIEKLKKLKGDRDWNELMKHLVEKSSEERMQEVVTEQDSKPAVEPATEQTSKKALERVPAPASKKAPEPEPVNTGKRYIPAKIKKHVIKETSGCCSYPGCTKPYDILHHTKRFAIDSTHDPKTLKPMCKSHERIAHAGLIHNEEQSSSEWKVRKEPDRLSIKYRVDQVVNSYYQKWQE